MLSCQEILWKSVELVQVSYFHKNSLTWNSFEILYPKYVEVNVLENLSQKKFREFMGKNLLESVVLNSFRYAPQIWDLNRYHDRLCTPILLMVIFVQLIRMLPCSDRISVFFLRWKSIFRCLCRSFATQKLRTSVLVGQKWIIFLQISIIFIPEKQ